jgi:hypothetical protein
MLQPSQDSGTKYHHFVVVMQVDEGEVVAVVEVDEVAAAVVEVVVDEAGSNSDKTIEMVCAFPVAKKATFHVTVQMRITDSQC